MRVPGRSCWVRCWRKPWLRAGANCISCAAANTTNMPGEQSIGMHAPFALTTSSWTILSNSIARNYLGRGGPCAPRALGGSPDEVLARADAAQTRCSPRPPGTRYDAMVMLRNLVEGCGVDHVATNSLEQIRDLFDRAVAVSPEASVAAYTLGDLRLLDVATKTRRLAGAGRPDPPGIGRPGPRMRHRPCRSGARSESSIVLV